MFSASRSGGRSRLPSDYQLAARQRSTSFGYSRDSYGINPKRPSSEERKSGSGSARRWSGARSSFSNEAKGAIKESRPLTDKAYQKKRTAELVEFLQIHDFKPPITQSKLMQPSKREFEMIFQFLVKTWDPTFEIKNLEVDAPAMLKILGYPHIPNKSVFTYVARTSFPALLGILVYLLDLAKFTMSLDWSNLLACGDNVRPEEHATVVRYVIDCYNSGEDNEEEHIKIFEQIIEARNTDDMNELQNQNLSIKEKLVKVQEDLENVEFLEKNVAEIDANIKIYEDYFKKMDIYKENKNSAITKLLEDLNQKVSISKELEENLSQKQALYDAQGFDGKKQLSYYEEHKKELNETLQKKKDQLRELQGECWDLEMQYSDLLDKGAVLCEDFNQLFGQLKDMTNSILHSLQSIKILEVQNVANNFRLEFPDFQMQFNQSTLQAWNNIHKVALEDIQKKINTTDMLLKTLSSAQSEELTEIQMKKSQVSTKLKCASSEENKKEQDLINLEKQSVEEIKYLEMKCSEDLEIFEKIQKENTEIETKQKKLVSECHMIEKVKVEKDLMLEKYLKEQKNFFNQLSERRETISRIVKQSGEEIAVTLQQNL